MQAGMSQEQFHPTALCNAIQVLQTRTLQLNSYYLLPNHQSSRTERNLEAGTDPRLRRGVGGEPVAPEAAGARRAGRGDGERRHGALQRRHPSHPLSSPSLWTRSPPPNCSQDNAHAFVRVPRKRITRSSTF